MSNIRKYLADAQRSAHNEWLGADGFIDGDLYFTEDPTFFDADGNGAAPSAAPVSAAPQSQPYIITVSNASAGAVSNFDVLGAFQYMNNAGFDSSGNLTISSVTISSAISNINYREFLYQSMMQPFTVGLSYIQSSNSSQVLETLTLNTRDSNGNQALKTLSPAIDPYQQQSTVIAFNQPYRIDGFTKLTIRSMFAATVLTLRFYPADNINLSRGLAGRAVSQQYGNPRLVKSSVAVVGGETLRSRLG